MFEKAKLVVERVLYMTNAGGLDAEEARRELDEVERWLEEAEVAKRTQVLKDGVTVLTSDHIATV
jgi:hypothetical protein